MGLMAKCGCKPGKEEKNNEDGVLQLKKNVKMSSAYCYLFVSLRVVFQRVGNRTSLIKYEVYPT